MRHLLHKWWKWVTYETTVLSSFYGIHYMSTRTCEVCGFTQDELVGVRDSITLSRKANHTDLPVGDTKENDDG